jgi:hypothetical protein
MLCPQLRYLKTTIRGVHYFLVDTFYFVAQYNGILATLLCLKALKLR